MSGVAFRLWYLYAYGRPLCLMIIPGDGTTLTRSQAAAPGFLPAL